jgi:hypothetical protein
MTSVSGASGLRVIGQMPYFGRWPILTWGGVESMTARGVVQSPVLVGRDEFLALARRRLAQAADGAGQLLFVAGEAGIGKSRLLAAIVREARAGNFAVAQAAAFPDDAQSLAGLLLDLASDLSAAAEPSLRELGQRLAARVRSTSAETGDAHRRRRLLVQDLADLLVPAGAGAPLLIVLEDLHWADELSLCSATWPRGSRPGRSWSPPRTAATSSIRTCPCATCGPA